MTTVKEFYEKLTILLVKNPKINDMNIDACGAPGSLFIWKKILMALLQVFPMRMILLFPNILTTFFL